MDVQSEEVDLDQYDAECREEIKKMWGDKAGYWLRIHDRNVAEQKALREAAIRRGQEPADPEQKKLLKELGYKVKSSMTNAESIIYYELVQKKESK